MNTLQKIAAISATLIFLNCPVLYSQDWLWAKQIGSPLEDYAKGICDENGNLYIAGLSYQEEYYFFSSPTLHSTGISDIFLAKFDNGGNQLWMKQFNVDNNCNQYGPNVISAIILDHSGNIYITGGFCQTIQFDTILLTTSFPKDFFIAKLGADGSCVWAKQAGGIGDDIGSALSVDDFSNVYVWGSNTYQAFFDTTPVDPGGFLVKYDSNGFFQWVKKEVSLLYDNPQVLITCMKINGNYLYAGGYLTKSTVSIDTITISHPGRYGHELCCFDLGGIFNGSERA